MRLRLAAQLVVYTWIAAVPASALGQSVDPMPYAEYRAGILAYERAAEARPQASGMPTVADVLAQLDEGQRDASIELARLQTIVPEDCYAPAHAEYLGFWDTLISGYDALRPQLETATTVFDIVPLALAWDAEIRSDHPSAYVTDADTLSGYSLKRINILDTLATCDPVVGASPSVAPASVVTNGSPPPPRIIFSDSGNGTKSTVPFELAPGDYELAYSAWSTGTVCGLGFSLVATDDSYRASVGGNGAWVYDWSSPYRNTTWFSVPTAGRFYLDVGGDCGWDATLSAVQSPLDGMSPVVFIGSGLGTSPAFPLDGGDYIVRYTLTSPASDEACSISTSGLVDPATPYTILGGEISQDLPAGTTVHSETYVYGVEAGRYQYDVDYAWCQFGVAEPVAWGITVEPQQ